ncbi:hypothetical protein DGG96_18890 [Legionella qingyii]|uniref:Ankyrin repeat domain-containing protein n=1 Tax=Legionella qingyii TaxID=2184757 RepID=A0A317TYF4_9GAMM|nr:ankyrin repeat domain-containing protein [Legionella qingyii]PWY54069.1 hypothetical protein DGG96_18890 [Legionella qingyii]RUR19895.1 ankyrin repeat domain-containing protein [Legionella qingyii]RUR22368.1 ankyrin repeat domain-containing protein [Legionella qingyii]
MFSKIRISRTNPSSFKEDIPEDLVKAITYMKCGRLQSAEKIIKELIDIFEYQFEELINSPLQYQKTNKHTLFLNEVVKLYPDNDMDLIEILLSNGANPCLADSDMMSAITLAADMGKKNVLETLIASTLRSSMKI